MREVSAAVSTTVQSTARVNVPVLPHVVSRCVVLAAHNTDISLLTVPEGPQAITLGTFGCCGGWGDLLFVDHVVGVVVGHVVILRLKEFEIVSSICSKKF
jgi:hypothetical protein